MRPTGNCRLAILYTMKLEKGKETNFSDKLMCCTVREHVTDQISKHSAVPSGVPLLCQCADSQTGNTKPMINGILCLWQLVV